MVAQAPKSYAPKCVHRSRPSSTKFEEVGDCLKFAEIVVWVMFPS